MRVLTEQVVSVLLEVLVSVAASQPATRADNTPLTGFSPQPCGGHGTGSSSSSSSSRAVEKVYTASKALLSIAKHRGPHLKVRQASNALTSIFKT